MTTSGRKLNGKVAMISNLKSDLTEAQQVLIETWEKHLSYMVGNKADKCVCCGVVGKVSRKEFDSPSPNLFYQHYFCNNCQVAFDSTWDGNTIYTHFGIWFPEPSCYTPHMIQIAKEIFSPRQLQVLEVVV
jgi:hypothetical protein